MTLEEKRAARYKFLKALYEASEGRTDKFVDKDGLVSRLGFDADTAEGVRVYLCNEHLAELKTFQHIAITHEGVVEIEDADSHPDEPTDYFPAVNNIFISGDNHAPIQQGSHRSQQAVYLSPPQAASLTSLLEELKTKLPTAGLPAEVLTEVQADVASIEAQLKSPKPKGGFVRDMLKSVVSALKDGAAKVVGEWFKSQIAGLHWW